MHPSDVDQCANAQSPLQRRTRSSLSYHHVVLAAEQGWNVYVSVNNWWHIRLIRDLALFEKHLEQYSPQDPMYEEYTNNKGKKKRRRVRIITSPIKLTNKPRND